MLPVLQIRYGSQTFRHCGTQSPHFFVVEIAGQERPRSADQFFYNLSLSFTTVLILCQRFIQV